MARDKREYGLSESDRKYAIRKKFGFFSRRKVNAILSDLENPSDKVLGAIVFLARRGELGDLVSLVKLANENEEGLLNSAQVKDDRT